MSDSLIGTSAPATPQRQTGNGFVHTPTSPAHSMGVDGQSVGTVPYGVLTDGAAPAVVQRGQHIPPEQAIEILRNQYGQCLTQMNKLSWRYYMNCCKPGNEAFLVGGMFLLQVVAASIYIPVAFDLDPLIWAGIYLSPTGGNLVNAVGVYAFNVLMNAYFGLLTLASTALLIGFWRQFKQLNMTDRTKTSILSAAIDMVGSTGLSWSSTIMYLSLLENAKLFSWADTPILYWTYALGFVFLAYPIASRMFNIVKAIILDDVTSLFIPVNTLVNELLPSHWTVTETLKDYMPRQWAHNQMRQFVQHKASLQFKEDLNVHVKGFMLKYHDQIFSTDFSEESLAGIDLETGDANLPVIINKLRGFLASAQNGEVLRDQDIGVMFDIYQYAKQHDVFAVEDARLNTLGRKLTKYAWMGLGFALVGIVFSGYFKSAADGGAPGYQVLSTVLVNLGLAYFINSSFARDMLDMFWPNELRTDYTIKSPSKDFDLSYIPDSILDFFGVEDQKITVEKFFRKVVFGFGGFILALGGFSVASAVSVFVNHLVDDPWLRLGVGLGGALFTCYPGVFLTRKYFRLNSISKALDPELRSNLEAVDRHGFAEAAIDQLNDLFSLYGNQATQAVLKKYEDKVDTSAAARLVINPLTTDEDVEAALHVFTPKFAVLKCASLAVLFALFMKMDTSLSGVNMSLIGMAVMTSLASSIIFMLYNSQRAARRQQMLQGSPSMQQRLLRKKAMERQRRDDEDGCSATVVASAEGVSESGMLEIHSEISDAPTYSLGMVLLGAAASIAPALIVFGVECGSTKLFDMLYAGKDNPIGPLTLKLISAFLGIGVATGSFNFFHQAKPDAHSLSGIQFIPLVSAG